MVLWSSLSHLEPTPFQSEDYSFSRTQSCSQNPQEWANQETIHHSQTHACFSSPKSHRGIQQFLDHSFARTSQWNERVAVLVFAPLSWQSWSAVEEQGRRERVSLEREKIKLDGRLGFHPLLSRTSTPPAPWFGSRRFPRGSSCWRCSRDCCDPGTSSHPPTDRSDHCREEEIFLSDSVTYDGHIRTTVKLSYFIWLCFWFLAYFSQYWLLI